VSFAAAFQDLNEIIYTVLAADQCQRQEELAQMHTQWICMAEGVEEAMGGGGVEDPCTIFYVGVKTSRPNSEVQHSLPLLPQKFLINCSN